MAALLPIFVAAGSRQHFGSLSIGADFFLEGVVMLCLQRLSTAVAFSFFFFFFFFLQIVAKIMRGYLPGLWFNWKVAIMYTALPWMLVNNVKEEGNPSICRIQALWLTILVWHSPCSQSIRREDRQRHQVLFWLWYILYLSSNRGPSFTK